MTRIIMSLLMSVCVGVNARSCLSLLTPPQVMCQEAATHDCPALSRAALLCLYDLVLASYDTQPTVEPAAAAAPPGRGVPGGPATEAVAVVATSPGGGGLAGLSEATVLTNLIRLLARQASTEAGAGAAEAGGEAGPGAANEPSPLTDLCKYMKMAVDRLKVRGWARFGWTGSR